MPREKMKAAIRGLLVTGLLAILIVLGSRNLSHFDAALVGYTFATLFAAFAVTYRHAMWLQRPPTAMYWKRGWQVFLRPQHWLPNLSEFVTRFVTTFVINRFIWRRGKLRWAAHWLTMWGCIIAVAITFPLVFGWIHFETLPDNLQWYRVFVFGFPTVSFPVESLIGFVAFHGLVWASFLVIAGVMLAMKRRMQDHGAAALQQFGEDFLPLILLFAISVTGLMLTASYTWMKGFGYDFLALLHAVTVIFTLLWLPFGKLFHVFQRPAQLGVSFYKQRGQESEQARCLRCDQPFAAQMHVNDLITVERQLGYNYELPDGKHYQQVCPKCRRAMLAIAQGTTWKKASTPEVETSGL
jgi:hypothetical protein